MSFAIPNSLVRDSVREFLKAAKTPKPQVAQKTASVTVAPASEDSAARKLFGLQLQNLTPDLTDALGFDAGSKGVLIADVESASPAEQAGLARGMVIHKIGRFAVNSAQEAET